MPSVSHEQRDRPRWSPTIALITAVAGFLFLAALFLHQPGLNPIAVDLAGPMQTRGGRVVQLEVNVQNHENDSLRPRFAIQHQSSTWNPLPWRIISGPPTLYPGQRAVYVITADSVDRSFNPFDPTQLIITSATETYTLRGSLALEPDRSLLWPGSVVNPLFHFWPQEENAPLAWQLEKAPKSSGSITFDHLDKEGILLSLDESDKGPREISLKQEILFPQQPIGFWVYSEPQTNESKGTAFGVSFAEAEHELWILFVDNHYAGPKPLNGETLYYPIPAGEWSYQEIDLLSIYQQLGWSHPPLKPSLFRGLDTDLRVITLRLLLASDRSTPGIQARFGPIIQEFDSIQPSDQMTETFQSPETYYLRLANRYAQQRNYQRALIAYEQALIYAPDLQAAQEGLTRMQAYLQEFDDE
jgi:hypothetical protein